MSGYEALRSKAAWLDLSERGKIRVTGEDRARLIHAMCTNHVAELPALRGLYSFFLSDKGRILADAWIYNLGDALLLDTEAEIKDKLLEHLDRFLIADDAELADDTGRLATLAIEGPGAREAAVAFGVPAGTEKLELLCLDGGGFAVPVAATGPAGIRLIVPVADKSSWIERFAANGIPQASIEEARTVRIENGVPRYGEEISERYLVQETGVRDAVHANKGCYLGQEIVERVRSRGQVHRMLMPVRIAGSEAPAPGAKLQAGGHDVAEISSAAYSPALGEVVGLAYVRSDSAEAKPNLVVAGMEPPAAARIVQ